MRRSFLHSKIHRATVTEADLNYAGSITIDPILLKAANIREFEKVDVLDITNGARLTTYAITGRHGSGEICINGAAAHLVKPGDLVIIVSYVELDHDEMDSHQPVVVHVDGDNVITEIATCGTAS